MTIHDLMYKIFLDKAMGTNRMVKELCPKKYMNWNTQYCEQQLRQDSAQLVTKKGTAF